MVSRGVPGDLIIMSNRKNKYAILLPLMPAIAAVAIYLLPNTGDYLEFNRKLIGAGEFWRLLTGHLTHFSLDHLIWDVLTFAVLGIICSKHSRLEYLVVCIGSAVVISLVAWYACPGMEAYRGLSGIDTALYCYVALTMGIGALHKKDYAVFAGVTTLLVMMFGKTIYELLSGEALFVHSDQFSTLPQAHIAGFISAGILFLIFRFVNNKKNAAPVYSGRHELQA